MVNAKKEAEKAKTKGTLNSTRNEQQKAKSREAAKARRKNENENIEYLTRLVPWIPDNPADKSTIIRLSTSYIGLMKVLKGSRHNPMIGSGCSATKGIENQSLEVLDGFIIILSRDGTITFVNDRVVSYLGFPPHELMGKKIYNFVLKKDWEEVARKLRGPLPNMDNPNIKEPQCDPDDIICEPDADELLAPIMKNATWTETAEFSVRMQCNLIRRTNPSKSTSFQASWNEANLLVQHHPAFLDATCWPCLNTKVGLFDEKTDKYQNVRQILPYNEIVRFRGRLNEEGYFLGTGEHAWSPDLGDLPVYEPAFISRLTHDLKLLFCEGRIHRYMDSEAKDIVGRVVYPFYHPTDVFHIQKMHSKLLAEGKVTTVPYRWMNKDGGWVWLKSTTTRIQDEKTGKSYMLCVNYVLSAIENKGVVVGVNPETSEKVVERPNEEKTEKDSSDAYLVDALTEVFTKTNPFGTPTYQRGTIQDGNVFNTNYQQKPRYAPPFTSSETKAKPLLEFYNPGPEQHDPLAMMEEPAESRFDHLFQPPRQQRWQDKESKPTQQNNFSENNSQHVEQFQLQDLLVNGNFAPDIALPGDTLAVQGEAFFSDSEAPSKMDYGVNNGVDELYIPQQTYGFDPAVHLEMDHLEQKLNHNMADQFDMSGILGDEQMAYTAAINLFHMNEVSDLEQQSAPMSNNYLRHNGFTQGMLPSNQEQCYNFLQVNHNNNILPGEAQLTNGNPLNLSWLAEEACIHDFDPTLLDANAC